MTLRLDCLPLTAPSLYLLALSQFARKVFLPTESSGRAVTGQECLLCGPISILELIRWSPRLRAFTLSCRALPISYILGGVLVAMRKVEIARDERGRTHFLRQFQVAKKEWMQNMIQLASLPV